MNNLSFYDYPLLNKEEEKVLFDKIKEGDLEARETLVLSNIGLVCSFVKKYCGDLEEMIQEGILGLLEAVNDFKPEMGNKFSTYAYFHVKKRVLAYLYNNSIYCPNSLRNLKEKVFGVIKEFADNNDKLPSFNYICDTMKDRYRYTDINNIKRVFSNMTVSIYGKEDCGYVYTLSSDEDHVEEIDNKDDYEFLIKTLDNLDVCEDTKKILFYKYFKNFSFNKISINMNKTNQWVKKYHKSGLEYLVKEYKKKDL